MGYQSTVGLPIPFGFEGNNVPYDLLQFAQRLDDIFAPRTYAQITALAGTDLWEGRLIYQTDTGALRPWIGFYRYATATATWISLAPIGAPASYDPRWTTLGTQPTWGNSLYEGRYQRFGSWCFAEWTVKLGSTWSAGSSTFVIPLPVDAAGFDNASASGPIGMLWTTDSSANQGFAYTVEQAGSGDPNGAYALVSATTSTLSGPSTGVTWAQNDTATGVLFYECVET